ncbi:MAG: response regulator [Chitinophagaceae bacterium]
MILVVDDKQENIFSLKTLLEIYNYKIDSASSGEEALKKIRVNSYDLLLLDVQMPGMDGFEVAEALSGYSKSKYLPIIFISAVKLDKKFISRGYSKGGIDYITKPFDPEILMLKVKSFCKLSQQTQQFINTQHDLVDEIVTVKEAEHRLNSINQELRSLIEAIPQIGFSTKPDGQIESVNKLWYTYSKFKDQFPIVRPGDDSIFEKWQISGTQGIRFEAEVKIRNLKSNEYRYHLLIMVPVKKDDSIVRWVGTLTDINGQKAATELLEQRVKERTTELQEINRRLEISNEELEQFASVASHDLKEPLRKINTYSSFIKDRVLIAEENGINYIDRIIYSSKRMTQMIDDLLNYSTLSATEVFKLSDLNTIIQEAILDLEHIISEKRAILHVKKLHEVEVIPSQMRQVFYNIISNALKFSKKNVTPVITIYSEIVEGKSIKSKVSKSANFCRITFTDNGIGFDEQYIAKIFMIFQRLNSKLEYEGHGIGLAMVKRIINKHNGIITATSKLNKGAKFIIVLPLKR